MVSRLWVARIGLGWWLRTVLRRVDCGKGLGVFMTKGERMLSGSSDISSERNMVGGAKSGLEGEEEEEKEGMVEWREREGGLLVERLAMRAEMAESIDPRDPRRDVGEGESR